MVDKILALGLIDVRDIEEVGTGPLMEEIGLDEQMATRIVERCAEEAKIVATEQEAKRAAEASAKAAAAKAPNALELALAGEALASSLGDDSASEANASVNLPGPMEAVEGGAAEVMTHQEQTIAAGDELSPEEQAIHTHGATEDLVAEDRKDYADEDADTAALAEGRTDPPTSSGPDEPQVPAGARDGEEGEAP